jgi:hypothetical protein
MVDIGAAVPGDAAIVQQSHTTAIEVLVQPRRDARLAIRAAPPSDCALGFSDDARHNDTQPTQLRPRARLTLRTPPLISLRALAPGEPGSITGARCAHPEQQTMRVTRS